MRRQKKMRCPLASVVRFQSGICISIRTPSKKKKKNWFPWRCGQCLKTLLSFCNRGLEDIQQSSKFLPRSLINNFWGRTNCCIDCLPVFSLDLWVCPPCHPPVYNPPVIIENIFCRVLKLLPTFRLRKMRSKSGFREVIHEAVIHCVVLLLTKRNLGWHCNPGFRF